MANSARRAINYTPRMTDYEALAALPKPIADALRNAVFEWDAYTVLRDYRKRAKTFKGWTSDLWAKMVSEIKAWDRQTIEHGAKILRGRHTHVPSSFVAVGVAPLYP